MRRLIIAMHVTLDGFVAGEHCEMGWISLNDELFDFVGELTDNADTALYGRKTFEMMDHHWPTAGDKPNATKHDKEHSRWYNSVQKFVLSNSMKGKDSGKTRFINGDLKKEIASIKAQSKNSILLFGSPTAIHSLLAENLIDEFYLFMNPVLLGKGIPLFNNIKQETNLQLNDSRTFGPSGVVCLHYSLK
jgi:dihydrofolate reductase